MHPYSVGNEKKTKITVSILLVILTSILYSLLQLIGIADVLQSIENNIIWLSPLIDWGFISVVITPIAIFGILYFLFNHYIWKWEIVNKFLGVPNVNGRYKGFLKSTYLNESTGIQVEPIEMILEVNQTFDSIKFTSLFPNTPSSSSSNMGGLISVEDGEAEFIFAYSNKSRDINIENDRHDGMNTLRFNLKNGLVEGEYFNNRGKQPNKGTMDLRKDTNHKKDK